jgi:SNF2 family DNA or RNA helicase
MHRQGQTRPVRVARIVAEGTIDERVLSVLAGKECTQNDLIRALKKEFEDDGRQISG